MQAKTNKLYNIIKYSCMFLTCHSVTGKFTTRKR